MKQATSIADLVHDPKNARRHTPRNIGAIANSLSKVGAARSIVIDAEKSAMLARQRPSWSVYEADSEAAIAAGAVSGLPFDIIDVDPYGSPFPTIKAVMDQADDLPSTVHLVVNDGLRQKVKLGAWSVECLRDIVHSTGTIYMSAISLSLRRKPGDSRKPPGSN